MQKSLNQSLVLKLLDHCQINDALEKVSDSHYSASMSMTIREDLLELPLTADLFHGPNMRMILSKFYRTAS